MIFLASLLWVAGKSFQQLNVVQFRWKWVPPTTAFLAATEMFVVVSIVANPSWQTWLQMTAGGSLGCLSSMWLNRRIFNRKEN